MPKHYLFLTLFFVSLGGCASAPSTDKKVSKNLACIETESAGIYNFYINRGTKVEIKEIDDVESDSDIFASAVSSVASKESYFCFAAGEHKLGFTAATSSESVNEFMTYAFEADKKYKLSAQVKGIAFNVKLSDVTNPTETVLKEFRVKISGAGEAYVPALGIGLPF